MGKESDKASVSRRRKHKFRMRRRARQIFPEWKNAERCADHLKMCSCWMCGNPRRYAKSRERLSWQERCQDGTD